MERRLQIEHSNDFYKKIVILGVVKLNHCGSTEESKSENNKFRTTFIVFVINYFIII